MCNYYHRYSHVSGTLRPNATNNGLSIFAKDIVHSSVSCMDTTYFNVALSGVAGASMVAFFTPGVGTYVGVTNPGVLCHDPIATVTLQNPNSSICFSSLEIKLVCSRGVRTESSSLYVKLSSPRGNKFIASSPVKLGLGENAADIGTPYLVTGFSGEIYPVSGSTSVTILSESIVDTNNLNIPLFGYEDVPIPWNQTFYSKNAWDTCIDKTCRENVDPTYFSSDMKIIHPGRCSQSNVSFNNPNSIQTDIKWEYDRYSDFYYIKTAILLSDKDFSCDPNLSYYLNFDNSPSCSIPPQIEMTCVAGRDRINLQRVTA